MTRASRAVQNIVLFIFALYALVPVYLVFLASIRSEATRWSAVLAQLFLAS